MAAERGRTFEQTHYGKSVINKNLKDMDIKKINQYKSLFDTIVKETLDDNNETMEVWYMSVNFRKFLVIPDGKTSP